MRSPAHVEGTQGFLPQCLEPPEAGRGGKDPPMETLQGAQPWDPLTSDVWSPGLGKGGCLWF